MVKGKLSVTDKKQLRLKYTNAKNKEVECNVSLSDLSAGLHAQMGPDADVTLLNGVEVELDVEQGQARKVRQPGETWSPPAASRPGGGGRPAGSGRTDRGRQPAQRGGAPGRGPAGQRPPPRSAPTATRSAGEFHNPYNFIPALPRENVLQDPDLGDGPPVDHDRWQADRYSGVLHVRLTLATPLLLPDAAAAGPPDRNGHKSYPLRLGVDGRPYLPPTSVKGMLRSAFEAVTNSRLGVFPWREDPPSGHAARLAYRMPARDGLMLVPARVEGEGSQARVMLLPGTSQMEADGRPRGNHMYAAWLRRYHRGQLEPCCYPDGALPQHGDAVTCWLVRVEHRSRKFSFWGVRKIFRRGQVSGKLDSDCIQVDGHVCVTGANINRKHDERVFFVHNQPAPSAPLTPELSGAWQELIRNYQETHAEDLRRRAERGEVPDGYYGDEPGRTAWSRHVYEPDAAHLRAGSLCYARVRLDRGRCELLALYPVMISRGLCDASPHQLLPRHLWPAQSLRELSPAERVFGWVNQNGKGAYRGNVRIGPLRCEQSKEDAVEEFSDPGLPLAILGQPKPQQGGFYVARDAQGVSQAANQPSKVALGYRAGKGLRGRKAYPHHAHLPDGYWADPLQDRTRQPLAGRFFQEYRRPQLNGQEQRDDQNRSVSGWVRPGTSFVFDMHVSNLSPVELGGLLWLLTLPEGHYHRLGGGKPLGFGSVRLELTGLNLRDGEGWGAWYRTLDGSSPAGGSHLEKVEDASGLTLAYKQAVARAYNQQVFDRVLFIAAFLRAVQGFADSLPLHYPRARQDGQNGPVPPHPEGLAYEWFVANDREPNGPHLTLPDLASDQGLPILGPD
jgi:CRISPR-associated protein (TIGR03986 family)